jgi:hypothetical protein
LGAAPGANVGHDPIRLGTGSGHPPVPDRDLESVQQNSVAAVSVSPQVEGNTRCCANVLGEGALQRRAGGRQLAPAEELERSLPVTVTPQTRSADTSCQGRLGADARTPDAGIYARLSPNQVPKRRIQLDSKVRIQENKDS